MRYVEIWRPLIYKNIKQIYWISNHGRIMNMVRRKPVKSFISIHGYVRIGLVCVGENGERLKKKFFMHRLVAHTFIENDPGKHMQVNHENGNKLDNTPRNLEWCTSSENVKHAFDTKLKLPMIGENNGFSKYNEKQIRRMCELILRGHNSTKIAKEFGVKNDNNFRNQIYNIRSGRSWTHIAKEYGII